MDSILCSDPDVFLVFALFYITQLSTYIYTSTVAPSLDQVVR